jgi:hypothetical protein
MSMACFPLPLSMGRMLKPCACKQSCSIHNRRLISLVEVGARFLLSATCACFRLNFAALHSSCTCSSRKQACPGTSWDRGVRRITLVRLCLEPWQSSSPDCAVFGQPVGVRSPGNPPKIGATRMQVVGPGCGSLACPCRSKAPAHVTHVTFKCQACHAVMMQLAALR